jgi:hypothetical protein
MPDRPSAGPTPTRRFRFTCIHCGRGVNTRARLGAYHTCPHCKDQPPGYGLNPGAGILRAVADAPATPPVKRRRKQPAPPPASTPGASPTAAPPRAPRRRAVVAAPPPQPPTSQAAPDGDIAPAPPPAPPAKRRPSLVDRILGHDEDAE